MIDFKRTIINLHKEFPEFDLDTLIKILDTIVETSIVETSKNPWWYNTEITCSNA